MDMSALFTITDIHRQPEFKAYSRRQIMYAIEEDGIEPVQHIGIIRMFSAAQLPAIKAAIVTPRRVKGARG